MTTLTIHCEADFSTYLIYFHQILSKLSTIYQFTLLQFLWISPVRDPEGELMFPILILELTKSEKKQSLSLL
jgi:hypothetical protein